MMKNGRLTENVLYESQSYKGKVLLFRFRFQRLKFQKLGNQKWGNWFWKAGGWSNGGQRQPQTSEGAWQALIMALNQRGTEEMCTFEFYYADCSACLISDCAVGSRAATQNRYNSLKIQYNLVAFCSGALRKCDLKLEGFPLNICHKSERLPVSAPWLFPINKRRKRGNRNNWRKQKASIHVVQSSLIMEIMETSWVEG